MTLKQEATKIINMDLRQIINTNTINNKQANKRTNIMAQNQQRKNRENNAEEEKNKTE